MARGKGAPRRSARPRVERQQASSPLQSLRLMMQLPSWVRWSSAATATSPTTTRREAAPSAEARAMDAACRALGLSSRQDVQVRRAPTRWLLRDPRESPAHRS